MAKRCKGNFFSNISIQGKLVISFATLLSIPLLILGIYSYHASRQNLERQSIETMENNLNGVVTELEARFSREESYVKYLSYNLNFRKELEQTPVDRIDLALELNNTVEPIYWYFITSDNYMKGIKIYTDQIDSDMGAFLFPAESCEDAEWYEQHRTSQKTVWTYQDGNLFVSRGILDTETVNRTIGVIRVDLYPSIFQDSLDALDYMDNGILVLDADGKAVYEHQTSAGHVDESVRENVTAGNIEDTEGYLLRNDTIGTTGWQVYYYIDRDMVSGQLQSILKQTLLVVAIVIAIAIVVITWLSQTLSRRILLLRDYAEQVAAGNLELDIQSPDTDEIGIVINSFGSMTRRLNRMINEMYKMQLEKKKIELTALQAQINPHFLYNALSSIKWKAIRQDNEEISELTGLLATFYRTSLNSGKPFTTVESELENIRSYVELQQHMHDFPFAVEYKIDPCALSCQMLNFLLQPVVENAIRHGIDYTDEKGNGRIIIECKLIDEFLEFRICNNGPEIQEEAIREAMLRPGKGYGLYNIRERIALYYGKDCGVSAAIDENGYTCFTVRVLKNLQKAL